MKVLLANKFFYDHGGPETVLFATRDLLQQHGHDVIDFAMQDSRNRPTPYARYFPPKVDLQTVRPTPGSLATAAHFLDSRVAAKMMRRLVRDTRPDIAHLHSINHQLTPSIIRVLREERVPVVMTLHDYKLVCPAYTMLAARGVCEECAGGRFSRAFTTSCRGRLRSALLSVESYLQHNVLKSYRGVSLFLSPSRFLAHKYREMGFTYPMDVLPNPGPALEVECEGAEPREPFVLFVGRVVPEKGLATLLAAAVRSRSLLKIAGDGPQLAELQGKFGEYPQLEFLGRVEPAQTAGLMRRAAAVAIPSEWYENQPMVILEAFAQGTPIIGSDIGGIGELVVHGETGRLHTPGDVESLARELNWASSHPIELQRLGACARARAAGYAPEVYFERLLALYDTVVSAPALPSVEGAR